MCLDGKITKSDFCPTKWFDAFGALAEISRLILHGASLPEEKVETRDAPFA